MVLRVALLSLVVGAATGLLAGVTIYLSLDWWQRRVEARTLPVVADEAQSWLRAVTDIEGAP